MGTWKDRGKLCASQRSLYFLHTKSQLFLMVSPKFMSKHFLVSAQSHPFLKGNELSSKPSGASTWCSFMDGNSILIFLSYLPQILEWIVYGVEIPLQSIENVLACLVSCLYYSFAARGMMVSWQMCCWYLSSLLQIIKRHSGQIFIKVCWKNWSHQHGP